MEKSRRMLFLDFDGVLCDSINECYVSSWLAFYRGGEEPKAISIAERKRFDGYRPFIRRGADYLLLQHCIRNGVVLARQEDFDAQLARMGERRMADYDRLFYEVRRELLEKERPYWLALNPPFAAIVPALGGAAPNPLVHIISTKRADYIFEIVRSWGLAWPLERIYCSGTEDKEDYLRTCLDGQEMEEGILVDDQIDHLTRIKDRRIRSYLASWGYVKPEWLAQRSIEVLDREGFAALLSEFA